MKQYAKFILMGIILTMGSLSAATHTWTGGGGSSWNTVSSWSASSAPGTGSTTTDVIIGGTTNVSAIVIATSGTYTVRSLTFNDANDAATRLVLSGATSTTSNARHLTFSSNAGNASLIIEAGSTGSKTIDKALSDSGKRANINLTSTLDVIHNGDGTLTMGAGDDVTTFGVRIQGAGGINKSGTGTLVLGGNTLYTGATTITGGTLEIGVNGRLGSGAYSANLTNNSTFIYSGTNNQTLSGTISGIGNMTKNAASTLTLSGNNSYSGTATINAGTLKVASAGALGQAETIVVNTGGSLLIGVDNSIGDSTDITLNGGTIKFEGDRNESVGALTLSADSIIDMSGGDIHLEFAILYAAMESYNLKIYNYSLYNDHLYFNGSTYVNESLPRIQFYSDAGTTLIGDSFIRDFGVTNEVCPVPEPGVYVTGLLLMGLMFYCQCRKKQNV